MLRMPLVEFRKPKMDLLDIVFVTASAGFLLGRAVEAWDAAAATLGRPMFDWEFYRQAVNRWLAGQPIYPGGQISTLSTAAGASYAYPPASVPLMLPFASDPLGRWLWLGTLVVVLLWGLLAVVRVGWPEAWIRPFCCVLVALGLFPPALEGIAVANVNVATAGALGLVWAHPRAAVPAASILGVIKVFPIALSAPMGLRAVTMALGVAAAMVIVTLPMVGVSAWTEYASALARVEPLCDSARSNPSLACAISPIVGPTIATLTSLGLAAVAVLVAVRSGPSLLGMTSVAAAIMMPAAELHAHYFSLLFVLAVIAMTQFRVRSPAGARQSPVRESVTEAAGR